MPDKSSDLVQGTLDMLILKTLELQPMHGYGVAVRIEQISRGVFRVNAGSLFVCFQRLQNEYPECLARINRRSMLPLDPQEESDFAAPRYVQ